MSVVVSHALSSALVAAGGGSTRFVDVDVKTWHWVVLLVLIAALLLIDLLVVHRDAHVIRTKEAAIESAVWIGIGVAFAAVIYWWFSGEGKGLEAAGEYLSGYLIEKSLSIDNVFVWALIMASFKVPGQYQHRVLFWGIFGALVMRAVFIFAGVALIEQFEWVLYIFGAFLLFTAYRILRDAGEETDPHDGRLYKALSKVIPTTKELDGQKLFTMRNGKRVATPLFMVLLLIEATDVLFAVDSVPAVLAVSHEQFIVFSSNAFAILGLRALYFLLADMHSRFDYLNEGLAVILAFVGVKMLLLYWDIHIPTPISLGVIALVLAVSIGLSLYTSRGDDPHEPWPFEQDAAAVGEGTEPDSSG